MTVQKTTHIKNIYLGNIVGGIKSLTQGRISIVIYNMLKVLS